MKCEKCGEHLKPYYTYSGRFIMDQCPNPECGFIPHSSEQSTKEVEA